MAPPPRSKRFRKSKSRSRGASAKRVPLQSKQKEDISKSSKKVPHQSKKPESPKKSPAKGKSVKTNNINTTETSMGQSKDSREVVNELLISKKEPKEEGSFKDRSNPAEAFKEPKSVKATSATKTSNIDILSTPGPSTSLNKNCKTRETGVDLLAEKVTSEVIEKVIVEELSKGHKTNVSMPSQDGKAVKSAGKENIPDDCVQEKSVPAEKVETEMTAEEKQALRKARKEQKKLAKSKPKEKAAPPDNNEASEKKKTLTKAERRDKQEAQRLAKGLQKAQVDAPQQKPSNTTPTLTEPLKTCAKEPLKEKCRLPEKCFVYDVHWTDKPVEMSSIFPTSQKKFDPSAVKEKVGKPPSDVHPTFAVLARATERGHIDATSCRLYYFIHALKNLISDYVTPPNKDLARDLHKKMMSNVEYLRSRQPLNGPVERFWGEFREAISSMDITMPDDDIRRYLHDTLEQYKSKHITIAEKLLLRKASTIIEDGDTILIFGYSGLLLNVVQNCYQQEKKLSFIVNDIFRSPCGKEMVKKLEKIGYDAKFMNLHEIRTLHRSVDKVIFESEFISFDGMIGGKLGCVGLLSVAKSALKAPVFCLAETFKITKQCFRTSEIINEEDQMMTIPLSTFSDLEHTSHFSLSHPKYDFVESDLVDTVITDLGAANSKFAPILLDRLDRQK